MVFDKMLIWYCLKSLRSKFLPFASSLFHSVAPSYSTLDQAFSLFDLYDLKTGALCNLVKILMGHGTLAMRPEALVICESSIFQKIGMQIVVYCQFDKKLTCDRENPPTRAPPCDGSVTALSLDLG